MNSIELTAIISFAFLGSIGHCIGMCGGFIMTYTMAKVKPTDSKFVQSLYHLSYNLGRVATYTVLGALFGYFGSLWEINPLVRSVMFTIAGILMVVMGLSFAGKLKFLNSIEIPISNYSWFKRMFTYQMNSGSKSSFFILGMLNGLLPCGLVYTMLVTATTTSSAFYGALVMFVFGIFTIPTLFTFAFAISLFSGQKFRSLMIQLAALTVIIFGIWTIYKAYLQFDYWYNTKDEVQKVESTQMKCGPAMKCAPGKCGTGKCGSKE
ncbi:sulfite exporter TauE/SafE family protein [bacterium]|nr:sulfite exporter TauE/SafE family protein [bacterium]MBU1884628.1 sulfite exporter TauE/SafE family protein [bacterium]